MLLIYLNIGLATEPFVEVVKGVEICGLDLLTAVLGMMPYCMVLFCCHSSSMLVVSQIHLCIKKKELSIV